MSENTNNDELLSEAPVESVDSLVLETPAVEVELVEAQPEVVEAPAEEVSAVVEETPEEPAVEDNVIASPKRTRSTRETSVSSTENNTVASSTASTKASKKSASEEDKPEKVAIHSSKNVTWNGVGKVYRGYNIVSKDAAEKWLTRSHVRLATPEEVAKEFGN